MKSTSYRLPEGTASAIAELAERLGMTQTQVVIVAIDRMIQSERRRKPEHVAKRMPDAER